MVLALGEATGHAHVVTGDRVSMLCPPDDPSRLFLLIEGYGRLGHEEHGAISLGPGALPRGPAAGVFPRCDPSGRGLSDHEQ
jgi:hypothetical protein